MGVGNMYAKGMILYNSKAGQNDIQHDIGVAVGILSEKIEELTIVKGSKPGDLERISYERGEEVDILFVMGGDGTVHECVNGLARLTNSPLVAILPNGTCNDFARSLQLPLTVAEACVVALRRNKKIVDIGFVNGRVFTNFVGIGLITKVSENIDEGMKEVTGSLSYLLSALKSAKEADPFQYNLKTASEHLEGEAVMIVAMNGHYIGTTELPFEDMYLDDGKLNVFIVKEGGMSIFLEWLQRKNPFIQEVENENIVMMKTSTLKIQTDDKMLVDTDGEIYLKTPLNIGVSSKPLTFITDL
ncbi:diacylglycerol/lipid kinase family protein [Salipaludibacillus daqingensis]|uniref:diacylglycerol/lipid kinase family protein n=1 Tax=Salipaludibacillus daqingensis TaxID=3041001 RepID=UPI002472EC35|nr:diacylglycerol kinase family lipid kinase [Salipaludibacillus daqingensis]